VESWGNVNHGPTSLLLFVSSSSSLKLPLLPLIILLHSLPGMPDRQRRIHYCYSLGMTDFTCGCAGGAPGACHTGHCTGGAVRGAGHLHGPPRPGAPAAIRRAFRQVPPLCSLLLCVAVLSALDAYHMCAACAEGRGWRGAVTILSTMPALDFVLLELSNKGQPVSAACRQAHLASIGMNSV
jgi:hypothetical protein